MASVMILMDRNTKPKPSTPSPMVLKSIFLAKRVKDRPMPMSSTA